MSKDKAERALESYRRALWAHTVKPTRKSFARVDGAIGSALRSGAGAEELRRVEHAVEAASASRRRAHGRVRSASK